MTELHWAYISQKGNLVKIHQELYKMKKATLWCCCRRRSYSIISSWLCATSDTSILMKTSASFWSHISLCWIEKFQHALNLTDYDITFFTFEYFTVASRIYCTLGVFPSLIFICFLSFAFFNISHRSNRQFLIGSHCCYPFRRSTFLLFGLVLFFIRLWIEFRDCEFLLLFFFDIK